MAGNPIRDITEQSELSGFQPAVTRCHGNRGRSGRSVDAVYGQLYGGHAQVGGSVAADTRLPSSSWGSQELCCLRSIDSEPEQFGFGALAVTLPGMQGTVDYSGDFPDQIPTRYSRMAEMKFMDTKFRGSSQYILGNSAAFWRLWSWSHRASLHFITRP